jgi:ubiquinone/menaquinone biosynthesis C-methylase UbiE
MAEKGPEPAAREAYEKLADSYAALAPTKPHNAYYERPATLSLLGDVAGKRVLDAGCGPGVYAEVLAAGGAEVVGFDASGRMVELARERLRGRAEIHRAKLEEPLAWLEDDSFDLVVSALAMDYVEDWGVPLAEFYRVLKPCGRLVFSVEHPTFKFVEQVYEGEGSYFETVLGAWSGGGSPKGCGCRPTGGRWAPWSTPSLTPASTSGACSSPGLGSASGRPTRKSTRGSTGCPVSSASWDANPWPRELSRCLWWRMPAHRRSSTRPRKPRRRPFRMPCSPPAT